MKKILVSLVMIIPFASNALDEAEKLQKAIAVTQKQHDDWMKFNEERFVAKSKLMRNHFQAKMDLIQKEIQAVKPGTDVVEFYKLQYADMKPLHQTQREEWKSFAEDWHAKGLELYDAHTQQLEKLAEDFGEATPEEADEESEIEIIEIEPAE